MQLKSLLCVCTGNICRSPLAEGLFRRDMKGLDVDSAGIAAVVNGTMPEPAQAIAEREELDLADHAGQQLTGAILREHDLVLVMEDGQRQWIAERFPESRGRVFMMTHWRGGADIRDPYRHGRDVFESSYAEIAECVSDWVTRLGR